MADKTEANPNLAKWMIFTLVAGTLAYVAWGWVVAWAFHSKVERAGAWADSFGPLTGFVSALALGFVAWSSNMQSRQLDVQRKELEAQREQLKMQLEELQLTRDEMKAQREEMEAQRVAQEKSAAAQVSANELAEHANDLREWQLKAQKNATRAQRRANELAKAASAIAISRGELEALRFASETMNPINIDTVERIIRSGVQRQGDNNQAMNKAADHIRTLRAWQEVLRDDEAESDND